MIINRCPLYLNILSPSIKEVNIDFILYAYLVDRKLRKCSKMLIDPWGNIVITTNKINSVKDSKKIRFVLLFIHPGKSNDLETKNRNNKRVKISKILSNIIVANDVLLLSFSSLPKSVHEKKNKQ